jgi:hypothetical protein
MSLESEIERAHRAGLLLDNEIFKESLDLIQKNIIAEWQNSKSHDKEGREDCYRQLKSLNEIKRHIESVLNTGKMAQKQKEEQSKLEQFKNWATRKR